MSGEGIKLEKITGKKWINELSCLTFKVWSFALNTVGDLVQYQQVLISVDLHRDPLCSLLVLSVQNLSVLLSFNLQISWCQAAWKKEENISMATLVLVLIFFV